MKNIFATAVLAAALPIAAQAATMPSPVSPNNLSVDDYLLTLTGDLATGFTLEFVADDIARTVTATFDFSAITPGAGVSASINGEDFTVPGSSTITFDLSQGESTSFVWDPGAPDSKVSDFELSVSSVAVPLPAALPLFAGALGAFAFVGRRRKAAA